MLRWTAGSSMLILVFASVFYPLDILIGTTVTIMTHDTKEIIDKDARSPNIILLTVDTFSAQHASVYGYPKETTPALRQLTQEASTFTQFYANGNWTSPGIDALLYGVRPWAFLLNNASNAQFSVVSQLKRGGYTTLAATSNIVASTLRTLTKPYFDESVDCAVPLTGGMGHMSYQCVLFLIAPTEALVLSQLSFLSYWGDACDRVMKVLRIGEVVNHFDPEVALAHARRMVMQWRRKAPFFLWVHLLPPHAPYASSEQFLGYFDISILHRTRFDSTPPELFAAREDPTFPHDYIGRYDESLLYVDTHIGRFMEWLKQQQLYQDAVIILTADHGESFSRGYGQHGGPLLHNDLICIPLLIKRPHQTQGQRIDAVVEQIDVLPTILDLVHLPGQGPLEGKSLTPILRGETPSFERPIFSMNIDISHRFRGPIQGIIAMIDWPWKYVHYRGYVPSVLLTALHDELYELTSDPDERQNLLGLRPDIAATMQAAIEQ
jgi:arylsulfatase A-like enzyme